MSKSASRRGAWAVGLAVLLAVLLASAWVLPEYYLDVLSKIMIFAILAVSMELILGTTGLVSFGQAAFFGVGAYAVALMQKHLGIDNALAAAMGAILLAAIVGAVVGALSLRTKGVYFIMVTLAFAQMMYHFAHDTPLAGGSDGIYLGHSLVLGESGGHAFELSGTVPIYVSALGALVFCLLGSVVLLQSKFGRALRGIGANERRMSAVGYIPYRYKLAVFILASGMAGLAGFLYCAKNGATSPEMMAWQQSGVVLLMVIIGGVGRLWGAVCGAVIYVLLQEALSSPDLMGPLADHWLLLFGIAVIVIVALWPQGFAGQLERFGARRAAGEVQ